VVCTGTACYIKGARELLKSISAQEGVGPGETTADGNLSVLTARCFGACGLAPVVVIDSDVVGRMTPDLLQQKLREVTQLAR
jgi:bidirectional [NiFe] hydrogenase diaphorase subunit